MSKALILGGARSGKSRKAEALAQASKKNVVYLATATAGDGEMHKRIELHQQQRAGYDWALHEEPINLAKALLQLDNSNTLILVDCLTLWVSNCLLDECWEQQKQALIECLPKLKADILFVSNEVGMGVVPMGELSRRFVDESGLLHQQLATHCGQVLFVIAGLVQQLKG